MASRSTRTVFFNGTDAALVRGAGSLDHGVWVRQPPLRIESQQNGNWESESDGVATGTEGEVDYSIVMPNGTVVADNIHLHWDNPFFGSNSYDESAPVLFKLTRSGGGGDNAVVRWTLDTASTTNDGIPDDWKLNGVTVDPGDGSGPQFIDLPSMGADVNRPDVFVQLDWMADSTHSHALSAAAIATVVAAFDAAPYRSRNGALGINLHVDAGPASIMNHTNGQTWGTLSRARQLPEVTNFGVATVDGNNSATSYDWTAFDAVKAQPGGFTSTGRTDIFRSCISAHQIGVAQNSGIARTIPGSDFIISLGSFATVTDLIQAGTFMHELGHLLGLDHGGGDAVNFKPNYVSVMSYAWQTIGVSRGGTPGIVDYSNAALDQLDEASMQERSGLGPRAAGVAISHFVPASGPNPAGFVQVADGSLPIDWDGNGDTTGANISFDTNNDGTIGLLNPYDDWAHLVIVGGAIGAGGGFQPPTTTSSVVEITPREAALVLPADLVPPVTTATASPPPNAAGWNRGDVEVTFTATDDVSGVAATFVDVDGTGAVVSTGPTRLSAEGVHDVAFGSVDRSQNVEADQHLTVRIDLTAPEAVITYDPVADDLVVTARDGLSGVDPGPVAPTSRAAVEWTDFGSDVAELRVYRLRDHADNETLLALKVRCSPVAWEASVVAVEYDDARHDRRQDPQQDGQSPYGGSRQRERNTIVFERLVGRAAGQPLLGVRQAVSIGSGDGRRTVRTRYDVLDDLSLVTHLTGADCCADRQEAPPASDVRGLVLLRVATDDGRLHVEEGL